MSQYITPGVYVEEFDSARAPTQGVSTSVAGFIGLAQRGQVFGEPRRVTSFVEYKRAFGGALPQTFGNARFLPSAVEQFFLNGGTSAFVMRVAQDAKAASAVAGALRFTAANPGVWGNALRVTVRVVKSANGANNVYNANNANDTSASEISLKVTLETGGETISEDYASLSLNPSANYIETLTAKSELIRVKLETADGANNANNANNAKNAPNIFEGTFTLSGGNDGNITTVSPQTYIGSQGISASSKPSDAAKPTGLAAFRENAAVSIMAIPGVVEPQVQAALISFCEKKKTCFAILDAPMERKTPSEVAEFRAAYDSSFAAMYHPWLQMQEGMNRAFFPPSGAVAGIYARVDAASGVHKAPANENLRGCFGLSYNYSASEQDVLNPKGVNLIRAFAGQGIRVWGARTLSADPLRRHVNVCRHLIYLEESIKENTLWACFERNDDILWARVKSVCERFLTDCWRRGTLAGSQASDAFFIQCGASTMTKDDIANGLLNLRVGVALVRPGEFVIFSVTRKLAGKS